MTCCTGGDCCGPGSYCCANTGPHNHEAEDEAWRLYPESYDNETGVHLDDWGYAECQRKAFLAGVKWARNN